MAKTKEQRKEIKSLKGERRNIRRSICLNGSPTTSRGRRNMIRLERYLLRVNGALDDILVATASKNDQKKHTRCTATKRLMKEDDIFSDLERALGITKVEPEQVTRSPPVFPRLPEKIVLAIMKHCHTFSDVLSFASTCSKAYRTWHSFSPFITEKITQRVVGSIADAKHLMKLVGGYDGKSCNYRTSVVKKGLDLKKTGSKAAIQRTEMLLRNHQLLAPSCEAIQHLIKRDIYHSPRALQLGLKRQRNSSSETIRVRRTVYNLHILMAYLQEPWPKSGLHEFYLKSPKRMILCMIEVCRFLTKHCGKDERRRFGVPHDFIFTEGLHKVDLWLSAAQMMGADRPVPVEENRHQWFENSVDFKYLLNFRGECELSCGEEDVFDF